jgi:hypothetical protein
MSLDQPTAHPVVAAGEPSVHVVRARKLLLGGAVGGVAATIICLVAFALVQGPSGLLSAALAAAMVLFFYGAGQYVMVRFADAGARTLLMVSLISYTARIVILGLVLLLYDRHQAAWPLLYPMAIFLTTMAVVAGWLVTELLVFSRLRIGVYDTEYQSPSIGSGQP